MGHHNGGKYGKDHPAYNIYSEKQLKDRSESVKGEKIHNLKKHSMILK